MGIIERSKFLRQKDVMLINDVPVKTELVAEEKFSSSSNLNLLTTLRTGRVNTFNSTVVKNFKGIISTKIYPTYLDYSYYGEEDIDNNFDFRQEFRKKTDLQTMKCRDAGEGDPNIYLVDKDTEVLTKKSIWKHTFYKLEHQKDVYISYRLQEQLDCLIKEILEVNPKLIILTGKWGLFFLTGKVSLTKTRGTVKDRKPLGGLVTYRSSLMEIHECFGLAPSIVIPMYHTIHSMAMPEKIPVLELDVQKLGYMYHKILEFGIEYYKVTEKIYYAKEDKLSIIDYLKDLLARLDNGPTLVSVDIETMYSAIIDCIGITDSIQHGLCIPFAKVGNPNIWSLEDEVDIMVTLREVMLHPNTRHVGQNYNYDTAFFNQLWCMPIYATWDTMVIHHILYNYLPKDLAFLASMYCENYTYWKGEIDATKESPEVRWKYNAKDITYTLEVAYILIQLLSGAEQPLQDLYRFQQSNLSPILDKMMWRGLKVDVSRKEELYKFFHKMLKDIVKTVNACIGEEFNMNSAPQKQKLFKGLLEMTLVKKRNGGETCDAAAMLVYIEQYPLYRPFLQLLLEFSSLKVFTNNFLGMKLDDDNRARTQYKIAGTATGRLASTKNVWGRGGNFMNIPSKGKIDLEQALALADESSETYGTVVVEGVIKLPNVKKIFLPDEGMEICDGDYSGADIMVVAADSECIWLNDFFDSGKGKVYAYVASNFLQREISTSSREYKVYKAVFHGCVTGDHEVLTKEGWVKIDEYNRLDEIMVWDAKEKATFFEEPRDFTESFVAASEELYSIEGSSFSFLGTQNHKFPYMLSSGDIASSEAATLNKTARIPYSGMYVGGCSLRNTYMAKLIAAFQADGTITYTKGEYCSVAWKFRKERKILRLKELLTSCEIPFKVQEYDNDKGTIDTRISVGLGFFEPYQKVAGAYLLEWDRFSLYSWLLETLQWDGHVRETNGVRYSVSSTNKANVEWINTIAHLNGFASKISSLERDSSRKTIYEVSINNRNFYRVANGTRELIKHEGTKVFCPTTSTGYFMCRRNGHIYVSGNSNYGMGINRLASMAGISVTLAQELQDYYFGLCPEVLAWQKRIIKDIARQGYITNIFGRRGWYLNKNDPMLHNKALSFIPQSTIADLVNHAMVAMVEKHPEIDILLQVHDSLVVQYDKTKADFYRKAVVDCMEIDIPYKPILKIPADIQVSTRSYGDVKALT